MDKTIDPSLILTHAFEDPSQYFGAVVPPIVQSTNFAFKTVEDFRKALQNEVQVPIYTRGSNPTVTILRKKVAALEKTEDALICSSGSAAIACAVISQVKAGDHVVCVEKPYGWTHKLLKVMLQKFNVETTYIDGTKVENWQNAIKDNTKLFFLESPNSWTFEIQDLKAIVDIAKSKNIKTIIDNSYATPIGQTPADYGVDIMVHSASKYLAGHSDVVAGALCASQKIIDEIFYGPYMTLGGVISPHDAWLMMRGIRTLELRFQRSSDSTEKIVRFLESHPKIEKVIYPFAKSHPQYDLAKKQMRGAGGLFSVYLKSSDISKIEKFCNAIQLFHMAVSWGGYESLFFPACIFHSSTGSNAGPLPKNMIRFYVGIENPDALIEDLQQAFANI